MIRKVREVLKAFFIVNLSSGAARIAFLIWHYHTHPGYYAIMSAPWYTEILFILAATGIAAVVTLLVYLMLGCVMRKREQK